MKSLNGSIINFYTLFILGLNIYASYIYIGKDIEFLNVLLGFIIFNSISILIYYLSVYNIKYDEKEIIIGNLLNPFYEKTFLLKDIDTIEYAHGGLSGGGVLIFTNSGRKFFPMNHIRARKLENFVNEIIALKARLQP